MRRTTYKRLLALTAAMLLLGIVVAPPAFAHGERSQEAFLRMRTIAWLDVEFSSDTVMQGEEVTVTGRAKIMDQWPDTLAAGEPRIGEIGIVVPGPQVLLTERSVNGLSAPGRIEVARGNYYDFEMTLVGRNVGRWHVHPRFSVKGAGTVLGPGQWIEVTENPDGFANTITLYNGDTVNLENYGLTQVWGWQVITFLVGMGWMLYWTVPSFHRTVANLAVTSQIPLNDDGVAVGLNSKRDHRVVNWFLIGSLALLAVAWIWQATAYPVKMPQQVVQFAPPPPAEEPVEPAEIATGVATFDPAADRLTVEVDVTNTGENPIEVAGFVTSTLAFENPALADGPVDRELEVTPADPIAPGATQTVEVSAVEEVFEEEHLIPIGEAQLTVAGMLQFQDDRGERSAAEIDATIRPDF
jgi:methane/ammonia monooxygenase subunit B